MKLRYTIPETAQLLGISEQTLYRRMRERQILVVKDGRRTFVTHAELTRYANRDHQTLKAS